MATCRGMQYSLAIIVFIHELLIAVCSSIYGSSGNHTFL